MSHRRSPGGDWRAQRFAPYEHRRSEIHRVPYQPWERESRGQGWGAPPPHPAEAIAEGHTVGMAREDELDDLGDRVMISNIPLDRTTPSDIRQFFEPMGRDVVVRFTPEIDLDDMPTGLGIVTFKNSNFARQALLKFNNRPLAGKTIQLTMAPKAHSAPVQVDQGELQARMFTVTDVPLCMDAKELVALLSHSVAKPIHIRVLREINIAIVAMPSEWHCSRGQDFLNHFFWNGYELQAREYDPTLDVVLGNSGGARM